MGKRVVFAMRAIEIFVCAIGFSAYGLQRETVTELSVASQIR
jgi:hypothetical protein